MSDPATQNQNRSPLMVAVLGSVVLALAKLVAFVLTNSLIVLGSLFDSINDAILSYVNHKVFNVAREDPDREHPFGHGGIEVVSSLMQGMALSAIGLFLLYQSVDRLLHGVRIHQGGNLILAFWVLVGSSVGGLLIHLLLQKKERNLAAKNQRTLTLSADGAHYKADFWYNGMNATGLLIAWHYQVWWADSVFAGLGSILFFKSSVPILKKCMQDIMHTEIDVPLQQQIVDSISATHPKIEGVHRLRSRYLGPTLFVDFHLKLPAQMELKKAHDIGDEVVAAIVKRFPGADVIVHLDPDTEPDDDLWKPEYDADLSGET